MASTVPAAAPVAVEQPEAAIAPEAALSVPQAVSSPSSAAARPVIVIEAPRRVSFERIRREEHRYPDQGMAGRFAEMGTELPPMFGEEF